MTSHERAFTDPPLANRRVTPDPAMASRSLDSILTVAEVAALMRASKMTVYRPSTTASCRAVRVGRSFRVHAEGGSRSAGDPYFGRW